MSTGQHAAPLKPLPWPSFLLSLSPTPCSKDWSLLCLLRELRALVIEMVLATDMSCHFQQVKTMKTALQQLERLEGCGPGPGPGQRKGLVNQDTMNSGALGFYLSTESLLAPGTHLSVHGCVWCL